jgi:hypothetical protein
MNAYNRAATSIFVNLGGSAQGDVQLLLSFMLFVAFFSDSLIFLLLIKPVEL